MFTPVFLDTFLSLQDNEGEYQSIFPFFFTVADCNSLLFDLQSEGINSDYWSAGWVNAILQSAALPTFSAVVKWQRLPLQESIFLMPSKDIYLIRVEPHKWIRNLSVKVWAS